MILFRLELPVPLRRRNIRFFPLPGLLLSIAAAFTIACALARERVLRTTMRGEKGEGELEAADGVAEDEEEAAALVRRRRRAA